jgi:hypothetical protein
MVRVGFILLQVSGYLILVGGIADFTMPFYLANLPDSHLRFLGIDSKAASSKLRDLDFALLRAVGGCLIAIGIGVLTINLVRSSKNVKPSLVGMVSMVTLGEGINASQMFLIHSPFMVFPLMCIIVAWTGAALSWPGSFSVKPDK